MKRKTTVILFIDIRLGKLKQYTWILMILARLLPVLAAFATYYTRNE